MLKNLFLFVLLVLPATSNAQSAAITNGLSWLKSSQVVTGSWNSGQSSSTAYYSTATVLETFATLGDKAGSFTTGLSWLALEKADNTTYLASKVKIVAASGGDTTTDVNTLLSYRNSGTGWGGSLNYIDSNFHTALALHALKAANYADLTIINPALAYLTSSQNPDGGWDFVAGDTSNIYLTSIVSATLQQFPQMTSIATSVSKATTYLLNHQNSNGSFGSPSTVYETALAFTSLISNGQTEGLPLQNAVNYLTSTQSTNGSWNDDPYSTALALKALYLSENRPAPPPPPPAGGKFTGTVVNSITLQRVSGATVALASNNLINTVTDDGGNFTLADIPPGAQDVNFSLAGFAPATAAAIAIADVTTNLGNIPMISAYSTGTISGTILDPNGAPLAGAVVNVTGAWSGSTVTGSDGNYAISYVTPGEVTISAAKTGYQSVTGNGTVFARTTMLFSPRLTSTGSQATTGILTGRVVESYWGRPIDHMPEEKGVTVTLSGGITAEPDPDNGGGFSIQGLAPNTYQVTVGMNGYASKTLRVVIMPGVTTDLGTIRLEMSASMMTLTGKVTDSASGAPIPGAQVVIQGSNLTGRADFTGMYGIADIPCTGNYIVKVSASGYIGKSFTISSAPWLQTLDIALNLNLNQIKAGTVNILSVTTDKANYPANADAAITVSLENSGSTSVNTLVSVQIMDGAGNVLNSFKPGSSWATIAPLATTTVTTSVPTAQASPGSYSINVKATDPNALDDGDPLAGVLAVKSAILVISASPAMSGEIFLTPPTLPADAQIPVAIKASLLNTGNIGITTNMRLEANLNGVVVYQQERAIADLLVNGRLDVDFGSFVPASSGTYTLALKPADPVIASSLTASLYVGPSATGLFLINPDKAAIGDTKVTGKVVLTGMGGLTGVAADLAITLPANIIMDSASPLPASTTISGSDKIYLWNFTGLNANGTELLINLTLQGLQSGEERKAAAAASLTYKNTTTGKTITDALSLPVVTGIAPFLATITVDKAAYPANAAVTINAALTNLSSSAKTVNAKVLIEDSNGALVQEIAALSNLNFVAIPTIDPVDSMTLFQTITLSGSKPADSSLLINGVEAVSLGSSSLWKVKYRLQAGLNTLNVTARNSFGQESAPLTVPVTWLSPVGMWHMDGDWQDASGNGNHGTAVNGAGFSDDAKSGGKSGGFNGANEFVRILQSPSLDITEHVTLHAWINTSNPFKRYQNVIAKNYHYRFGFYDTTGRLLFQIARATTSSGPSQVISLIGNQVLSIGWHHIVCTYDGTKLRAYIDGKLDSEVAYTGKIYSQNYDLLIAQQANDCSPQPQCISYNYYFQGLIDEVAVYNRALSADEVTTLYEASYKIPPGVNPVAPTSQAINGLIWNTGVTTAGDYRARIILFDNQQQVAEATASFSILPDNRVSSKLTTNKVSYNPNEQAGLSASVTNLSVNSMSGNLTARITVSTSPTGSGLLYTESRSITALMPGASSTSKIFWNTGTNPAGTYFVTLQVLDVAGVVLSTSTSSLTINSTAKPTALLKGKIALDKQSILSGEPVTVSYSITNVGNVDVSNMSISIQTVHSVDQSVYSTLMDQATLAMGSTYVNSGLIDTVNYSTKDYLVVLRASIDGVEETLAGAYFRVEGAPTAPILSGPATGTDVRTFSPLLSVSNASDPNDDRLFYEFVLYSDSALTNHVASGTVSETSGATKWAVPQPLTEDLTYYWRARAYDGKLYGDWMTAAYFRVDTVDNPPLLTVSTLADGSYTNNDILNVTGTVFDDSDSFELKINDITVPVNNDGSFSYALLLSSSENMITTVATDVANNITSDTRTIHFDQSAPKLTIFTPDDNSKTAISPIEVKGRVDETSTVTVKVKDNIQTAAMNGTDFSATVLPLPGWNTIEITARDLAGNPGSQKRTVLFDDQKPSLSVTDPAQDIRTNKSSLTISGKASDPVTAVGITVEMEGTILTPQVTDGIFSQIVTFAEEKPYPITITAANEVGTQTTVQRNVIYDKTPPKLTIDPVVTPTNGSSQTVTGTREEGTTVAITCATATIGSVEYPTSTTWQVTVIGLTQGENRLEAESTDLADNRTTANATILYVPRAPDITISASTRTLWPPNKKLAEVIINGGVVTYGSEIQDVTISIADEYGKYNQQGLKFGDTVLLEAWREGNDMDGRIYTVTAVVTDQAGNRTTRSTTVIVPHDLGK